MPTNEATAALAANPAALVLARRDLEQVLEAVQRPYDATVAAKIKDFRESLIGLRPAEQLALIDQATREFGAILAKREQEVADTLDFQRQQRAEVARREAEYIAAQDRRGRLSRATHPILSNARARIVAFEMGINAASSPADLAALQKELEASFKSCLDALSAALKSIMGTKS